LDATEPVPGNPVQYYPVGKSGVFDKLRIFQILAGGGSIKRYPEL